MQSHRLALPWCGAVASRAAARASAGQRRACVTSRRDSDPCSGRSPRTRSSARTWPWSEAEKRCPAPGHCLQRLCRWRRVVAEKVMVALSLAVITLPGQPRVAGEVESNFDPRSPVFHPRPDGVKRVDGRRSLQHGAFEQAPPRGRGRGDHCGRGRVVPELKATERAKGVSVAKGCEGAVLRHHAS